MSQTIWEFNTVGMVFESLPLKWSSLIGIGVEAGLVDFTLEMGVDNIFKCFSYTIFVFYWHVLVTNIVQLALRLQKWSSHMVLDFPRDYVKTIEALSLNGGWGPLEPKIDSFGPSIPCPSPSLNKWLLIVFIVLQNFIQTLFKTNRIFDDLVVWKVSIAPKKKGDRHKSHGKWHGRWRFELIDKVRERFCKGRAKVWSNDGFNCFLYIMQTICLSESWLDRHAYTLEGC